MAESVLSSLFGLWNKLEEVFSPAASSSAPLIGKKRKKSAPLIEPKPTQLNEAVYEVFKPPPGEKPELEVVFFHGLQMKDEKESYLTTWVSQDNSEFWLPWLEEVFPKARVLVVSYDASAERTNSVGRQDMYIAAENLVVNLTSNSVGVGEAGCPIVLVGHCLGGLVLKELCLSAGWRLRRNSASLPSMQSIRDFFHNLRGMFFYGTPHTGCLLGDKLQECLQGPRFGPLLADIEILKDSTSRRNEEFRQLKEREGWITHGVGELHETFMEYLGKSIHVVPEASTRPYMDSYYSASADHYTICKPMGKRASTFQYLTDFLKQIHEEGVLRAKVVADAVGSQDHVVDLKGRAYEVERMLAQPDAHTVFIVGMSGVGKTTIAKQVFRDISHTFAVPCFIELENIEPQSNGSEQILKKIEDALHRVDKGWTCDHYSVLHYLQGKKVLMIVDNVESQRQLDALRKAIWLEGSSSRLIVTTTNSRLGSKSNTFEVPYLNDEESRQLFLHYALEGRDEPRNLSEHIDKVIRKCDCFPLALKIIGSYVGKEDLDDERLWLGLIERLEKAEEVDGGSDYRLLARLRPCYDSLPHTEQQIFLDVAVVFHGLQFTLVEYIWTRCWGNSTHVAYMNLKRRFLVSELPDGRLWTHEQLRNLGRSIACPPGTPVDEWKRISSLESAKDLIARFQGGVHTRSLKICTRERLILRNTTFLHYSQLLYLILDGVETAGGRVELPRALVYMRWKGALFDACPVDFTGLENLAVLDLQDCHAMRSFPPSLLRATKLLWLELEGCLSLRELPLELFELHHLKYLGLGRTGLTKLPRNIGKLTGLTHLNLQQTQLTRLSPSITRLNMLLSLNLSNTPLRVLPESIGDLRYLRTLEVSDTSVSLLPESIGQLRDLRTLNARCTLVKTLPESLGNVARLEQLELGCTPLEALPDSLCRLRSLKRLGFEYCRQLSALPDSFGELANLEEIHTMHSGVRTFPETFRKLSRLRGFNGNVSTFVGDQQHLGSETYIASLADQNHSDSSDSIGLELMTDVIAREENAAGQIQAMTPSLLYLQPHFQALYSLHLIGDSHNESDVSAILRVLQQMPNLYELVLSSFMEVETMPCELGTLIGLEYLRLYDWRKLRELPESMGQLLKLRDLRLQDLPRLCILPESLGTLPIDVLFITRCGDLRSFPETFGHPAHCESLRSSLGHAPLATEPLISSGDNCPTSGIGPSAYHTLRPLPKLIATDSWSIVRCLVECCTVGMSCVIDLYVTCAHMERIMEMVVEEEPVLPAKSMKRLGLELYGADDGIHEIFTTSTSWACLEDRPDSSHTKLFVRCGGKGGDRLQCDVHTKRIPVVVNALETFDIGTDNEDSQEEEDVTE